MKVEELVKIQEASLSRLWSHNEAHDCGAISAFRVAEDCGEGKEYSKSDNRKRNKSLLAKLKSSGYGVTTLKGVYPEGGKSVTEESYFVVDIKDKGQLEADIRRLGELFEQDSVLIVPKGSITGEAKAFLVGTNRCKSNWINYGQTEVYNKGAKLGVSSPVYASYVNGRPFIFESVGEEVLDPGNGLGWAALGKIAEKHWNDL